MPSAALVCEFLRAITRSAGLPAMSFVLLIGDVFPSGIGKRIRNVRLRLRLDAVRSARHKLEAKS
jgi:hypothetical protein